MKVYVLLESRWSDVDGAYERIQDIFLSKEMAQREQERCNDLFSFDTGVSSCKYIIVEKDAKG